MESSSTDRVRVSAISSLGRIRSSWLAAVDGNLLHRWDLPVGHRSWNLQTWIRAVGATPLDSENSVDHPAYGTVHLQLNWDSSTEMQWSCGIRNVNNTAYSGWHQLNGVYGKYYNPAPPRTFWVGITWRAF